jgi:hypothetical protein
VVYFATEYSLQSAAALSPKALRVQAASAHIYTFMLGVFSTTFFRDYCPDRGTHLYLGRRNLRFQKADRMIAQHRG